MARANCQVIKRERLVRAVVELPALKLLRFTAGERLTHAGHHDPNRRSDAREPRLRICTVLDDPMLKVENLANRVREFGREVVRLGEHPVVRLLDLHDYIATVVTTQDVVCLEFEPEGRQRNDLSIKRVDEDRMLGEPLLVRRLQVRCRLPKRRDAAP